MFGTSSPFHANAADALAGLARSLAIIEFDLDGKIRYANELFLAKMGYTLDEVKDRHHSIFMPPDHARSPEYNAFWQKLGRGEHDTGEYRRIAKGGREVWIKASYNPVRNSRGKLVSIIKQATDVTPEKLRSSETEAKMSAVLRAQAVIEFTPSGEIITANDNFLQALGYRLDEIVGRHHRIFVEPAFAQSPEYRDLWRRLNAGEYVASEFRRVGKGGKEVWIQASYNPVFGLNGEVVKIVKFATDVSERVRAVSEIANGLAQVTRDNLAHRIGTEFVPAFEQLRTDYNASMSKFDGVVKQIAATTLAIQSSTSEISGATNNLARRTETQAASLEETAAALDQITSTVKKAAEGAAHAREVVAAACKNAEASGEVVGRAVNSMNMIEASSRKIGQVIGVIDEIAFQTNLLALNAGVEAARAGDAGKGFAVVAQEVRALSQRSAEEAKTIKSLISASATQVNEGVGQVAEAGKALQRIIAQVSEIDAIVSDMASAAHEQASALQAVNVAVNQMDRVTQQNAAMVEETAAASQDLAKESNALNQMVARFRTTGSSELSGDVIPFGRAAAVR